MRKEVSSIKGLEYFKEKSPLLSMFLDKKMSKDRSLWLSALNEQIDEEHLAEFTARFGTDWDDTVNALTLMVRNFGFQENVDIQFAKDITRSVLFIGYEIGDVSAVDVILPKVCDQLKNVDYLYPGWLKERVPKIIAYKVVGGMLKTGAVYKIVAYDKNDRLAPFSDFVKGLNI